MKMKNIMPILLIPSVISTTFLPLMLPGIKMMVMFVMMINQMAFSMALMSLIRGMIFGPRVEDEIVYVNKGYQNEKKHHHPPPSLIVPSGAGGPPIGHHEEPIHFGDASQVSLAKQEPPLIINSMPENFHNLANNFIRQQPNFVNHQIIRPHFVNQRVIRPINPQIQQMIHPNIIHRNRPDHEIQIAPIHHIPQAAVKQIHQISTASVSPPVHHVPAQAIAPIHHIPQLPNRDQTVFVHQQAEVPEIVRYPQPNVHSNEIPEHQSHDLDTGLFAEPIGHQQNLVVHENWHD
ncbi:uncharacterized protein LOC123305899 [Chrysoperla carnea]|uniref:uncharacterized protein LOC123305899 n=1 Tax=Chrysoperla carnea TaxID=189513 RepID=UPI001D071387|nr:uncharacterized protein LOC123305899 [Chrysoperla carnea]